MQQFCVHAVAVGTWFGEHSFGTLFVFLKCIDRVGTPAWSSTRLELGDVVANQRVRLHGPNKPWLRIRTAEANIGFCLEIVNLQLWICGNDNVCLW